MPVDAFLSYSHADEKRLDRLHKHLAMLQRDGSLRAWSDHKILVGDRLGDEIDVALDQSGLFLALVSPDYLASNYCYEKEFERALELDRAGRLRIVAIICEPCDWLNSPFKDFLVAPKDGKPISDWTNENTAYLGVVQEIRRILAAGVAPAAPHGVGMIPTRSAPDRRSLRVKKQFDTIERAEYADNAFEVIRGYFKNACDELPQADEDLRTKFEVMDPTAFTCMVVNRAMRAGGEAYITVRNNKRGGRGGGAPSGGDISLAYQRYAEIGTSSGWVSVDADEYSLFLTGTLQLGMSNDLVRATPEQVAEALWVAFIKRAGISYE